MILCKIFQCDLISLFIELNIEILIVLLLNFIILRMGIKILTKMLCYDRNC
jgi:hypothetical protein